MKFLFYEGRHGERILMPHNRRAWEYLLKMMNHTDGCTLEEAREEGFWVDGGTFEEGYVAVDDGGRISTIDVTPVPAWTNGEA